MMTSRKKRPIRLILALLAVVGVAAAIPFVRRELDPEALRRADESFRKGDATTALHRALKYLESRPNSRSANRIAAVSLSRLDQPDRAEPYYQCAGRLGLDDQHLRALAIVRANQRDKAIRAYTDLLTEHPDDILALRRLAGVRISQTQYIEAMDLAERLTKLPDGQIIGYTLAGLIYHRTGYTDQSVGKFEHVLKLDPELRQMPLEPAWQFWAFLAEGLLSLGRSAEARGYLVEALKTSPEARLAGLLGRVHRNEGDMDEAEKAWRLATQWNPQLGGPWLELGRLALDRDQVQEAVALLERAAALTPASPEPAYSLSLAYRRLGQAEAANRLAARAEELRKRQRELFSRTGTKASPTP
ncbi:tetratricopeptide repeat protein [Singulisphaera sp. PoT]|uniref:tetratricopeptide repeat protein n=1 Tax=Singulisphaera sp. PoT TaxID=3411797 RepID=UPI003BF4C8C3